MAGKTTVGIEVPNLKRERVPDAIAAYRKTIELEPKRRDLLRRIADCHAALYQWGQAATVLGDSNPRTATIPPYTTPVASTITGFVSRPRRS